MRDGLGRTRREESRRGGGRRLAGQSRRASASGMLAEGVQAIGGRQGLECAVPAGRAVCVCRGRIDRAAESCLPQVSRRVAQGSRH